MDYISKRKNNIQSISIYCRPHQGLREEKPFCELPPLPLHLLSYQERHGITTPLKTARTALMLAWSRERFFQCFQTLIPATLECDTMNPAIHCPLLQALYRHVRKQIHGPYSRFHDSEMCYSPSSFPQLLCRKQHRAVAAENCPGVLQTWNVTTPLRLPVRSISGIFVTSTYGCPQVLLCSPPLLRVRGL